ncbi:hypothetical protein WG66_009203 [Moniliophthora roreri]|nr:hypothetical protein WG66_009203 [Moniliophthora roreri]
MLIGLFRIMRCTRETNYWPETEKSIIRPEQAGNSFDKRIHPSHHFFGVV